MDASLPGSFLAWGNPALWSTRALSEVSEVAQSCPTLCDPMDCSLPGSSVHGIFQARVLEWVSISFSRRSSWPRDRTQVSRIVGRRFTVWATREVQGLYGLVNGDFQEGLCQRGCSQTAAANPPSLWWDPADPHCWPTVLVQFPVQSTSPIIWVLVHTRLCLCPPRLESVPPVLWKSCNQILALKVRFPGDFQSLCPAPRLGSLIMGFQTFTTMGELLWYYCFSLWVTHPAVMGFDFIVIVSLLLKPFTTDWDLNPCGWDSNPAKTLLGTWTHDAGAETQPKPMVPGFMT